MLSILFLYDNHCSNEVVQCDLTAATNLFSQGKRSLVIHDFKNAVTNLEEATMMFDQIYGVGSEKNGDCYLNYGIALFELSREESGVLDGVVQNQQLNVEEEETEDEDDEETEGDEEEEDSKTDLNGIETKVNGNEISAEVAQGSSSQNGQEMASQEDEPIPGTSNGEATEGSQEVEAEPTNAEIAWEVLTLARDCFAKTADQCSQDKLKLAEALQTMGEISLEWENFESARDLFEESLSLKKEVLPSEDRSIAESYYQIGISYSFLKEIERANDCFRLAIGVIESRIEVLKKEHLLTGDSSKMAEVSELESLLPDMSAKIEDSRDQMTTAVQVEKMVEDEDSKEAEVANKVHNSPSKAVNNISHLVKRKRPVEVTPDASATTSGEEQPVVKKLAADTPSSSNGHGAP